jgi:hypothetical protein
MVYTWEKFPCPCRLWVELADDADVAASYLSSLAVAICMN